MSERASTVCPRACSGDMYCTVPITKPGRVCSSSVVVPAWRSAAPELRLGEFGNPEVQHLRITIRPKHDVFGFDVAMHDAGLVRGSQRRSYLHGNFQRVVQIHSSAPQQRAQSFTFDELSRDEVSVSFRADLVNRKNVWMI